MKKYFFYGLAILLPLVITYLICLFFLNLLTNPFIPITKSIIESLIQSPLSPEVTLFITKLAILILLFTVAVIIGALTELFFIKQLFRVGDLLLHKIPMISKIYKPLQDLFITVLGKKESSKFSQVVLVPFPSESALAIGMVTRHNMPDLSKKTDELYAVFVPGTPNPSMGFMLSFREDQLIFLDMEVKEALTFVVSCGVVLNPPQTEII